MAAEKLDPDYVALDLTYRCGFACGFCFVKNNSLLRPGRRELNTAGFINIINGFAGKKRRFYVTGGEPGLRKDLPEIVRAIKAGGHRCLITTNACAMPPALLKRLADADEFVISIHGGPALHDRTAAAAGAFKGAALAARLLTALPTPRPSVTLWCTINRANHARLPAVYRAMAALRPDNIAFNHLEYVSEKDFKKTERIFKHLLGARPVFGPSEKLARGIDAGRLAAGVEAVKKADGSVRFYPALDRTGIKAWYNPDASFKKSGFCSGQWNAAWISPYGELLTCQPLAFKVSANAEAPPAAYNGPAYAAFRQALKKAGGFFPSCARCGREPYTRETKGLQTDI